MKATLEFDLTDEDSRLEHYRSVKSLYLALALYEVDQRLRQTDKYGKEPMTREEFCDILRDNEIDLENLIR